MAGDRVGWALAESGRWAAGLCLLGLVGLGTTQVFCRYVLNAPLRWPEELSRMLFVWLTYCGALVVPSQRLHVAVDALYVWLPMGSRRCLDALADLAAVVFFGALAIGGVLLVGMMRGLLLPALQLPMNLLFGVIPLVAVLQVYVHLAALISGSRGHAVNATAGHPAPWTER
jgi:TRAP-type C4-dicarboxylate transport system permease small subunit